MEGRLELLRDDTCASHMVNIATLNGQVHLYIVHFVCEPIVVHMIKGGSEAELGVDGAVEGEVDVETEADEEPAVVDGVEVEVGVDVVGQGEGDGHMKAVVDEEHVVIGGVEVEVVVGRADKGEGDVEVEVQADEEVVVMGGVEVEVEVDSASEGEMEGESDEEPVVMAGAGADEGEMEVKAAEQPDMDVEVEADEEDDMEGEETYYEGDDDYEVRSWTDSKEEVMGEDELYDVRIETEELEDDLYDVIIEGTSGSSRTNPKGKNVFDRGLSDSEWESETLDSCENSDASDDDRDKYGNFGIFPMPKSMEDYNWEVGTYFAKKEEFTEVIRTYGMHNGRKLKKFRNDKRRIYVKCLGAKGKCKWYAYCSYKAAQSTWQLRRIINTHTCNREFNVSLMTSKWLSGRLEKTLRENPNIKLTDLKNKIGRKWNIDVSRSMAFRARTMAYNNIDGSFQEQYKRVYDYAHELLRSNPSSTVKVHVDENEGNSIFKRLYVCLKTCKDSFFCCRPIIGVDGCFLKGKYRGELLTTVGRDGNDQMLPLAYTVVEVENKETWTWFLDLMIEDLGGAEICSKITFMSDQ